MKIRTSILFAAIACISPAHGAEFRAPDGSGLSNAIAEQFVRPMLSTPAEEDVAGSFQWLPLDVDGDAYDELFIKLVKPDLCGVGGCPIVGFMRQPDESWHPVLTAVGDGLSFDEKTLVVQSEGKQQSYRYDSVAGAMLPITAP